LEELIKLQSYIHKCIDISAAAIP